MTKVEWYFDYISPFSYLQWAGQLPRLQGVEITCKPLLFAGLLKHWGHKGPAEMPGKRRFTYRHVTWLAGRMNVPFRMPAAHPFNPLPLLRLGIARDNQPEVVDRLFGFVWREGHIPADTAAWGALMNELGADDGELKDPSVKQRLMANGEEAIGKGVFGVPTMLVDGEVFWGVDGFDFLTAYLEDPSIIRTPEMQAADELPSGI
jgi:2-hydroxychromene-2-carboxylate isomerase